MHFQNRSTWRRVARTPPPSVCLPRLLFVCPLFSLFFFFSTSFILCLFYSPFLESLVSFIFCFAVPCVYFFFVLPILFAREFSKVKLSPPVEGQYLFGFAFSGRHPSPRLLAHLAYLLASAVCKPVYSLAFFPLAYSLDILSHVLPCFPGFLLFFSFLSFLAFSCLLFLWIDFPCCTFFLSWDVRCASVVMKRA